MPAAIKEAAGLTPHMAPPTIGPIKP
jgi:hypothetical protein